MIIKECDSEEKRFSRTYPKTMNVVFDVTDTGKTSKI